MKKSKVLGLGVCALALGVIAGAVSAQRAQAVEAAMPSKVYVDVSALSWFGDASAKAYAYVFNNDYSVTNADYPGAEMESVSAGVYSVDIPSGATKLAVLRMNPSKLDESGIWNKSADIALEDGKDLLTITALGNGTSTSTWGTYSSEADHAFVVVGSSAALGEWTPASGVAMSAADVDGYLVKKEELSLAAGDLLKVVDKDATAWYGAAGFYASDATRAKFRGVDDGNGGYNLKVITAGSYSIYLRNDHKLAILSEGEELSALKPEAAAADGYYILGLDTWRPIYGIFDDKDGESSNLAEFHNVALKVGDTFKVVKVADGAGVEGKYYGTEILEALDANPEDLRYYTNNDMRGRIEAEGGESSSTNFKVLKAGTYSVYLFGSEAEPKISIVDEGFTNKGAVAMFVERMITPYLDDLTPEEISSMSADDRSDSCKEKYDRALPEYGRLSDEQKTIFEEDSDFDVAEAAYLEWKTVATQGGVMSVTTLNNKDNTPLIITLIAIAGAAIAGASIFFALRKKKNNN